MAANKKWQNVSDFMNPILQQKCGRGTIIREVPTGKTWSREPTRAQLEEGPACQDWPTGKHLTTSWKEPHGTFFSGFRRQLDEYESLDLSPAEKAQITDNLNKPDSTTCHGNYHQPNLDKFVTETLSARRSARTTRRGRRTWSRPSTLRPPWTWTPPRWADRTGSPSSLLRTWCPARDPLVRACSTR